MNELSSCMHSWKISCITSWVYIWTQLFACLHKNFLLKKDFLIKRLSQFGRIKKSRLVLPLNKLCSLHNTELKCSCFHDLDKFGDCANDCAGFLIRLWGLLTFACDIKLVFNSSQSEYNLCLVFRFGFATMSLMSLFLIPFQSRSHILHWFFWWVPVRLTLKNWWVPLQLISLKNEYPLWAILKNPCSPKADSTNDEEANEEPFSQIT